MMVMQLSIRTLLNKYTTIREERVRSIRRMFAALMCVRKFRRRVNKKGPDIDTRMVRDLQKRMVAKASIANCIVTQ